MPEGLAGAPCVMGLDLPLTAYARSLEWICGGCGEPSWTPYACVPDHVSFFPFRGLSFARASMLWPAAGSSGGGRTPSISLVSGGGTCRYFVMLVMALLAIGPVCLHRDTKKYRVSVKSGIRGTRSTSRYISLGRSAIFMD